MEATKNQSSFGKKLIKIITRNPIVFLLLIAAIVVGCMVDNFFSWGNLTNLLSNTAIRFLIALGVSGCLITKGTDLSAGRQVGFAAVIAGIMCQRGDYNGRLWKFLPEMNIGLVFIIVVAFGLVWGLINGFIVTKLHVPPFIATLGTQTIIYGISLVISDAQPIGGFQKIYTTLINGRIGDVKGFHLPYLLFVAAVFGIVFWFIYNKMRFGKYMYAVGGNPNAAQVSGVNVNKILVAIVAFGVNSGAYVSEIIRSGIKGVDPGQIEAGRSLGLRFRTILYSIVYPQAFKNSLPALTNEFISLIKETSICGYIGLTDLTRGGDIIRSMTYEAMLPLLAVAAIYFILVAGLSSCVAKLEKRLKKNER